MSKTDFSSAKRLNVRESIIFAHGDPGDPIGDLGDLIDDLGDLGEKYLIKWVVLGSGGAY